VRIGAWEMYPSFPGDFDGLSDDTLRIRNFGKIEDFE
jgi:hypothetical protein